MRFNPGYDFDNYISTITNKFAYTACLGFAEAIKPPSHLLFLYGPTSVGKTHLLHAIGNHITRFLPSKKVILTSAESMINALTESIGSGWMERVQEKYAAADLLLMDDIHVLSGRERTTEAFFYIFDALMSNGVRLAMASLKRPADMPHFSYYLKLRIKKGLMLPLKYPSRSELELILTKKFATTIPKVPYNLIQLVVQREMNSDIRRAVGMVNQLAFTRSHAGFKSVICRGQ